MENILRGDFFGCRVLWRENFQNMKSFQRTTQIPFILALFFTLRSELSLEQYLVIAKHQATRVFSKFNEDFIVVNFCGIITEINTKVASIRVSFSSRRTPGNLFILTLFLDYVVNILFKCY